MGHWLLVAILSKGRTDTIKNANDDRKASFCASNRRSFEPCADIGDTVVEALNPGWVKGAFRQGFIHRFGGSLTTVSYVVSQSNYSVYNCFNLTEEEIVLLVAVYAKAERGNMAPSEIRKAV